MSPLRRSCVHPARAWLGLGLGLGLGLAVRVRLTLTLTLTQPELRYEWRARGVNPTCKELYLHDDEFARLFGMGKAAFYAQRQWQQRDAKQKLQLF